jgi:quercetin dioxygenase-like cupin family protein
MKRHFRLAAALGALCGCLALTSASSSATPDSKRDASVRAAEVVRELLTRELPDVPGKEVRMLTVEYPPGAASPEHRHNAEVFVYVLEGTMRMQVKGSPLQTLRAGQTFYEGPADIHSVSANASDTAPAKILVFMVRPRSAPATAPDR